MISQIKYISVLTLVFVGLAGCKEDFSYIYLMQHPKVLKKEVMRCEASGGALETGSMSCDIVMRAANDFTAIINEQQNNPEKFGQRILEAETACAKAKSDLNEMKQSLTKLKNEHASNTELQAQQEKLDKMKKNYEEKRNEVKILLAVAGLNSPE